MRAGFPRPFFGEITNILRQELLFSSMYDIMPKERDSQI